MVKYTLNSLGGKKIEDYQDKIANAVFDVVAGEDDVCVTEDGFEVSAEPSADELSRINTRLAADGLVAVLQG